jgi:hypothetical protein
MTSFFNYILIGMMVFLLNACATTYETKTGSVRSQNLLLDTTHDGKDLVLTFPAWTSEADKRESLNSSAIAKASQKCPGVTYKLININSTPYVFSMNISTTRVSGISANIQCDVAVKDISTASTSIDKAVTNLRVCHGSEMTKWSNCFAPFSTPSGVTFVGEWKDGKFHGQGTLTSPIGWKYEGEFRNGVRYGQGTHIDKDGNKYVGAFKDGKEYGNGVLTFRSGNKYVGEFRDGKRNGQGTYSFASGNKYIGEFRDEKYNGQGTLYSANGSILQKGTWVDGKLIRSESTQPSITPNTEFEIVGNEAENTKRRQTPK